MYSFDKCKQTKYIKFLSNWEGSHVPFSGQSLFFFSYSKSLGTTDLSFSFTHSSISYKWTYTVYFESGFFHLRFIYVDVCISNSCLVIAEIYPIVRISYNWFIHSILDGSFRCFQFGATMNKVTINVHLQTFVRTYIFISLG